MRMETCALEAFAAVMTLGTATAAADVLGRSQPAITRSLQQLEERIGFALFERRGGRLVPTSEARELYESVRESFALVSGFVRGFLEALEEVRDDALARATSMSEGDVAVGWR